MAYLSVDIPVAGDWPNPEEMNARNAITDELDAMGFGEFSGAGGGMGSMDFSYTVANAEVAEQTVKEVISKHLPNREFSVRMSDD